MITTDKLQAFPSHYQSLEPIIGDIVIIQPAQSGHDGEGNQEDWRFFNVYVIVHKPYQGWSLGQSDSIELSGKLKSDIKNNGLLCYWNSSGKVRVRGVSTLEIEAVDDDTPVSLMFEFKEFLHSFYQRLDNLNPALIEAIEDEHTKSLRSVRDFLQSFYQVVKSKNN